MSALRTLVSKTLKIFSIFKIKNNKFLIKKKNNKLIPASENKCESKRFKACALYPRIRHF